MAQHGQLSAEDAKIVRWAKDQHERRGGFIRIFPRAETWSTYGGLLELKTHTNELLAQRLFPETYRPGSAVVRSRHLEKPGEGERFERYERRLESLNKKRRKKKKLKSKKAKQKKTDIKTIDDEIEDEDDEPIKMREPIMNAVPAPPIQSVISVSNSGDTERKDVVPRDNIVKSEVYKSIRAARERKKNGEDQKYSPPSIQPPTKDAKLDISLVDESGDRDKKTEKKTGTDGTTATGRHVSNHQKVEDRGGPTLPSGGARGICRLPQPCPTALRQRVAGKNTDLSQSRFVDISLVWRIVFSRMHT